MYHVASTHPFRHLHNQTQTNPHTPTETHSHRHTPHTHRHTHPHSHTYTHSHTHKTHTHTHVGTRVFQFCIFFEFSVRIFFILCRKKTLPPDPPKIHHLIKIEKIVFQNVSHDKTIRCEIWCWFQKCITWYVATFLGPDPENVKNAVFPVSPHFYPFFGKVRKIRGLFTKLV